MAQPEPSAPPAWPSCTSVCSSRRDDERAGRALRLGVIESILEPLPVDGAVAREWGRLAATVQARGREPRRRPLDLAIAASANAHNVSLLTHNSSDFQIIDDLVTVHAA